MGERVKSVGAIITEAKKATSASVKSVAGTLTLQVSGSATSKTIVVRGRVNAEADFVTLPVYDPSFTKGTNITKNGVYSVYVDYMREVEIDLTSVSGGVVNVYMAITD